MSRIKTHVNKGDQVQVIAGNHKGKTGQVTSINAVKGQVIVDGVRPLKKAVKRSEKHPDGGIINIDGPVHISNVKKLG
ncbi:MAG: 50S ribosomal protein L24 [Akkermansiaceae bacterium]|nr:50S ribosomal protein L24 [Akkermansiaceae bacterium]MCF7730900.1 50S ribosomal protein L24 [Akkermansiaceae bacterium]